METQTGRRLETQTSRSAPRLAHTGRAATLLERESPEKERRRVVMKIGEDNEEMPNSLFSSDSSAIANLAAMKTSTLAAGAYSPQLFRHRNYGRQLEHFSQPQGEGFTHAHTSKSSDNLRGLTHSGGEWSSSDEGEVAIECSICLQQFEEESSKTPRNLQCGHAYCTGCLEQLLRSSQVDCPICNCVTVVEGNVVSSLPKNYPLMSIVREAAQLGRKISRGRGMSPAANVQPPQCPEHDDYLRSYCLKCKGLVCSSCELYGTHRGHPTKFLNEAAQEERAKLKDLSVAVFRQKQKMKVAVLNVEETQKAVQEVGGKMEDQVDEFYDDLIALIKEKKQAAKMNIRMRTQLRVKALLEQAGDLRDCIERADAVYRRSDELVLRDDFVLLSEAKLTLDLIEGVFTNPPPTLPRARNDLRCTFQEDLREEVASFVGRASTLVPDIVTIDSSQITIKSYYDGFRISWPEQNFVDNLAISYHLQAAKGDDPYLIIYRGSATKYTWKLDHQHDVSYRFRLQVRTTEGVGNWSEPKEGRRAEPGMHWHSKWRSVKVDLSANQLEASWIGSGGGHWGTFAADKLFEKSSQHYAEIEILSLGRHKSSSTKERLAIGVIGCGVGGPGAVDWQNSKSPIGEWGEGYSSWSFLPISGLLKSHTVAKEGVRYGGENLMIQSGDRIGVLVDLAEGKLIYFCNGYDLGVAFDDLVGRSFILAVSIRDKIKVRLRFPPPPYSKRKIKLINLRAHSHGGDP